MNNELLEQVSFTLDLMYLERKMGDEDGSVNNDASSSIYVVEETLRVKGVRAAADRKQK